jgi:hypothetical protein
MTEVSISLDGDATTVSPMRTALEGELRARLYICGWAASFPSRAQHGGTSTINNDGAFERPMTPGGQYGYV